MSYADCMARLVKAAGRNLSSSEAEAIFTKIEEAAKKLRQGESPEKSSSDPFIQRVAKQAAMELKQEAMARERAAHDQILANERNAQTLRALANDVQKGLFKSSKIAGKVSEKLTDRSTGMVKALELLIRRDYTGSHNVESFEQHERGVRSVLDAKLAGAWDAMGEKFFGLFNDKEKVKNFIRALKGEKVEDANAMKAAQVWRDTAEYARTWFNDLGGRIGKLDDPYLPQYHPQETVSDAHRILSGKSVKDVEANQKAWVDYMLPKLEKTQEQGKHYVDDNGIPWTKERLREFLNHAFDSITTNGMNKREPGEFRSKGNTINRHKEHRQIHFADAEDLIDYWEKFGNKSLVEVMYGHLHQLGSDIASAGFWGPNKETTYRYLRDLVLEEAAKTDRKSLDKVEHQLKKVDELFDYASGKFQGSVNPALSNIVDSLKNLASAGSLGGAPIASLFGDRVSYEAVRHLNNLPEFQSFMSNLKALNPKNKADRIELERMGLLGEYVRNSLNRLNDDMGEVGKGGWTGKMKHWTGKIAGAQLRMLGMNAINELPKGAFGTLVMDAIGRETMSRSFDKLHESDLRVLKTWGVTEKDWGVWKLAKPESSKFGGTLVTPESISKIPTEEIQKAFSVSPQQANTIRRDAIVKLLGAINTEADFAIATPGYKERAAFYAGVRRGEVKGEFMRAFAQFKSFSLTFFNRELDAILNKPGTLNRAAMFGALIAGTTMAGAMIIQTRNLQSGRDLEKTDNREFWGRAFLQGGALGIYGDFLQGSGQTRYGSGPLEVIAGPVPGKLLEMGITTPLKAIADYKAGRPSHFAANELNSLRGFIPGNNAYPTKAITDHLIWQKIMDSVSPGYISRLREREQQAGRTYWWEPGTNAPQRAPDLSLTR